MAFSYSRNLANPLNYPLAVLAGGVILVIGVRILQLPPWVALPTAIVSSTLGAAVRKAQLPTRLDLSNNPLNRELEAVYQTAQNLANAAIVLRQDAAQRLTEAHHMDLLVMVQLACDRAEELPVQIQTLAQKLQRQESLFTIDTLQQQLQQAQAKAQASQGVVRDQWQRSVASLQRNLKLAQQGKDAQQVQVISLSSLILETAEILQNLQLQLHQADLNSGTDTASLLALSDTLKGCQENMDMLMR